MLLDASGVVRCGMSSPADLVPTSIVAAFLGATNRLLVAYDRVRNALPHPRRSEYPAFRFDASPTYDDKGQRLFVVTWYDENLRVREEQRVIFPKVLELVFELLPISGPEEREASEAYRRYVAALFDARALADDEPDVEGTEAKLELMRAEISALRATVGALVRRLTISDETQNAPTDEDDASMLRDAARWR